MIGSAAAKVIDPVMDSAWRIPTEAEALCKNCCKYDPDKDSHKWIREHGQKSDEMRILFQRRDSTAHGLHSDHQDRKAKHDVTDIRIRFFS